MPSHFIFAKIPLSAVTGKTEVSFWHPIGNFECLTLGDNGLSAKVRNEDYLDFRLGGKPDLSEYEISNITSGCYGAILSRSLISVRSEV